ncbi:protoglobin domain-containing protein [Candidatus Methylacidithermus pantelleriae]|nr:protoglobin domain-containing protein [Candidatus Methylacidithermus pantelleriae]
MEDPKSWSVKDQELVKELVDFLGINEDDRQFLRQLHGIAATYSKPMVEEFSSRILQHPNTREYYEKIDVPSLQEKITGWFQDLFLGEYGAEYAEKAMRIGKAHVRIGLPLRYPLAMWDLLVKYGEQVVAHSPKPKEAFRAFHKVLALSIALFIQAYEDSQLAHLSQFLGSERLVRRLLMEGH